MLFSCSDCAFVAAAVAFSPYFDHGCSFACFSLFSLPQELIPLLCFTLLALSSLNYLVISSLSSSLDFIGEPFTADGMLSDNYGSSPPLKLIGKSNE